MEKAAVNSKRNAILAMTHITLFAALISAGAFISIPLPFSPVPLVLQNFFAVLSGLVLGPLNGGLAAGLFLLAGALGAPVFSGAAGGLTVFLRPSGGFLFGYLLGAVAAGLLAGNPVKNWNTPLWRLILAALAGFLVIYVPGLFRLKAVLDASWLTTFAAGFFPFLIGDTLKGILAVVIAKRLRRLVSSQING